MDTMKIELEDMGVEGESKWKCIPIVVVSDSVNPQWAFTKKYIVFYVKIQGRRAKIDCHQEPFAHSAPDNIPDTFEEAVNILKPSTIIGK